MWDAYVGYIIAWDAFVGCQPRIEMIFIWSLPIAAPTTQFNTMLCHQGPKVPIPCIKTVSRIRMPVYTSGCEPIILFSMP